jgi:MerR family copper efflux transcriptional regulator
MVEVSELPLVQIGDAAERTEMSLRTLRHWNDIGLVVPSARSNGGFRLYSEADIQRIQVIKSMKPLSLTLEEIRELLELLETSENPQAATPERDRLLNHYADRTRSRISSLNRDLVYATGLLEMLVQMIST